jgi:hypothetical protein
MCACVHVEEGYFYIKYCVCVCKCCMGIQFIQNGHTMSAHLNVLLFYFLLSYNTLHLG